MSMPNPKGRKLRLMRPTHEYGYEYTNPSKVTHLVQQLSKTEIELENKEIELEMWKPIPTPNSNSNPNSSLTQP